ncbi:MAG: hypothetical protein WCQ00_02965 [bacterium]
MKHKMPKYSKEILGLKICRIPDTMKNRSENKNRYTEKPSQDAEIVYKELVNELLK